MHMPLPGMVDHPGPYLYKPLDDPVYGWLEALKTISNITSQYACKITEKIVALLATVRNKSLRCPPVQVQRKSIFLANR